MKNWICPLPYLLVPTADSESFQTMQQGCTGLPLAPHPGGFGVQRKYHTHEGVDLYAPISTPVMAVEAGEVVKVAPFTGEHAGLPWWHNTWGVWVEGESGVVLYGEIAPHAKIGQKVIPGEILGVVIPVLKTNKGRPTSMLHLELHSHGSREAPEWIDTRPSVLRDPTPFLHNAISLEASLCIGSSHVINTV